MTDLFAKAGALFVAPAAPASRPVAAPPTERFVALVAAADDLQATAGGLAAALRREGRARTAVVCTVGDPVPPRAASPAAAALARRLAGRDHPATATGSLCRVALPEDPAAAVRDVWRLTGAVDVPLVLALPGRLDGFDRLLAGADHLYLATAQDADPALVELARASLAALGPATTDLRPPRGPLTRRASALGLVALRRDVAPLGAPA